MDHDDVIGYLAFGLILLALMLLWLDMVKWMWEG